MIPQSGDFRFSDEEIQIAKETDLPDLLASLGYTVKRVGSYYTTMEAHGMPVRLLPFLRRSRRSSPFPFPRPTPTTAV